jgi:phage portal protein BeeE
VPPHLAGDTEKSTSWGTGIEQMDIGYAKHTITPLCVRIEQELNRKLFAAARASTASTTSTRCMRGDFKSRMEGLQIAVGPAVPDRQRGARARGLEQERRRPWR